MTGRWLFSYRVRWLDTNPAPNPKNVEADFLEIFEHHPLLEIADNRLHAKLLRCEGAAPGSMFEIIVVYSITPVPEDLLTEDQIDLML